MFGQDEVRHWQQTLSAALEAPSDLDDRGRIDQLRALEELVCTATAAQAVLTAELDSSVRAQPRAAGERSERQGRGVAAQVALARRESPHRGQRHLGLAKVVATELPHTWHAWSTGRITEWTATVIARETACLTLTDRLVVDAEIAGDPEVLELRGPGEVAGLCAAAAARLDPASVVERRRRAEADRTVTLRAAPDTMTRLSGLLPVKDGVAVIAVLGKAADTARAAGDPRTRGQVMADTLIDRLLGRAAAGDHESSAIGVDLGLVMTDTSLFGHSDEDAHLTGFGPIPAELGREIVAGACSRGEDVWLRRLWASPTTGELVTMTPAPDVSCTRSPGSSGSATRSVALHGALPPFARPTTPEALPAADPPPVRTGRASARPATTPNKPPAGAPHPSTALMAMRSRPPRPPVTTTAPTPRHSSGSTIGPLSRSTSCWRADGGPARCPSRGATES